MKAGGERGGGGVGRERDAKVGGLEKEQVWEEWATHERRVGKVESRAAFEVLSETEGQNWA